MHNKTVGRISIKSRWKMIGYHLQWTGAVNVSVSDIFPYLDEKQLYPLPAPTELLCPKP